MDRLETGRGPLQQEIRQRHGCCQVVEHAGFDPYERKVLGVTAMQKLLGNPALMNF
jgi:hypothetical protein